MRLFGIALDTLSDEQLQLRFERWLAGERYRRIATVNPEFLVLSREDSAFRKVLRSADLRLVDGFGIVLVAWLRGRTIRRVTGVDVTERLLQRADENGLSVYLAVRADGLSSYDEIRTAILKRYPNITVEGADRESVDYTSPNTKVSASVSLAMRTSQASILFCNFGAPEQEYFLESVRQEETPFRIAVGVGGALDYLTGKKRRAPRWMCSIGLEWLWRLCANPKRLGRIWRATVLFLYHVFCIFRQRKKPPVRVV